MRHIQNKITCYNIYIYIDNESVLNNTICQNMSKISNWKYVLNDSEQKYMRKHISSRKNQRAKNEDGIKNML